MFVAKKQEMVPPHKLMPYIHPDTRFRNGSRAMKWRESTPSMSFGRQEVDWACSLHENQSMVTGARTNALYPPRYAFSQWVM